MFLQGTEFMLALAQWLREWAEEKISYDRRFAHTTFVISDASEPGELRGTAGYLVVYNLAWLHNI